METTVRSGPAALRSRWTLPAISVLLGVAILVAQWIGGDPAGASSRWRS